MLIQADDQIRKSSGVVTEEMLPKTEI